LILLFGWGIHSTRLLFSEIISSDFSSDATSHLSPGADTILDVNRNFSQELRKKFPNTPIIPVLGKFIIF
jgi:hypothetical protein